MNDLFDRNLIFTLIIIVILIVTWCVLLITECPYWILLLLLIHPIEYLKKKF